MFILSAGMPKSGSTLFSFYQKHILENAIKVNGQSIFEQMIKDGSIGGIGIFVHNIESPETIDRLYSLSTEIGPFVVKTHTSLTAAIRKHLIEQKIIATYIHRDPRDVILSAIDHAKRPLTHPTMNPFFLQFSSVQHSIAPVREFCKNGKEWIQSDHCVVFKYHDLMVSPETELMKFCKQINYSPSAIFLKELINQYTVDQVKGKRQYNTGKISRYQDEMTSQEIHECNHAFEMELKEFGYM